MSFSASERPCIASSGFSRKCFLAFSWTRPFRKRLSRRLFALLSRSKTYLLKERHRHRRRHRQVVVLVQLLRVGPQRAAHDQPHDHLGALVAAEAREVIDGHLRQALGILLDEIEELAVPLLVVEAGALADHLVREAAGAD